MSQLPHDVALAHHKVRLAVSSLFLSADRKHCRNLGCIATMTLAMNVAYCDKKNEKMSAFCSHWGSA